MQPQKVLNDYVEIKYLDLQQLQKMRDALSENAGLKEEIENLKQQIAQEEKAKQEEISNAHEMERKLQ